MFYGDGQRSTHVDFEWMVSSLFQSNEGNSETPLYHKLIRSPEISILINIVLAAS